MQLDGWTDVQNDFDEQGLPASRIFTMIFIFLGHFIFTNIFIGVIITNISESTEHYEVITIEFFVMNPILSDLAILCKIGVIKLS